MLTNLHKQAIANYVLWNCILPILAEKKNGYLIDKFQFYSIEPKFFETSEQPNIRKYSSTSLFDQYAHLHSLDAG